MEPIKFIGLVVTRNGYSYEVEFDLDAPLSGFDMSQLPSEFECVEILRVVYGQKS